MHAGHPEFDGQRFSLRPLEREGTAYGRQHEVAQPEVRALLEPVGVGLRMLVEQEVEAGPVRAVEQNGSGQSEALGGLLEVAETGVIVAADRKSTRLNSSHVKISYAVFCLKKKI